MAFLFARMKLVVEPGGAAGFAALLAGKVPDAAGRRVGVVLSGGNVDPERVRPSSWRGCPHGLRVYEAPTFTPAVTRSVSDCEAQVRDRRDVEERPAAVDPERELLAGAHVDARAGLEREEVLGLVRRPGGGIPAVRVHPVISDPGEEVRLHAAAGEEEEEERAFDGHVVRLHGPARARPAQALVTGGDLEAEGARQARAPVQAEGGMRAVGVGARHDAAVGAPLRVRIRVRLGGRGGGGEERRGGAGEDDRAARHRGRTLPRPDPGSLIIAIPVAGRTWKDDLPSLILALAAQLGLVRAVDWARANTATHDLARSLVENHFYFAPQIGSLLVVFLFARLVVNALNLRGVAIGDWLRSSALLLVLGLGCLVAAHLDQILALARGALRDPGAARRRAGRRRVVLLAPALPHRDAAVRDRPRRPPLLPLRDPPRQAASPRRPARTRIRVREGLGPRGRAYLKAGDVRRARRMFKKGRSWARLAALEMRDGDPAEAARLYQDAGDAWLWEASRAWQAAGNPAAAEETGLRALQLARTGGRWDRLAEIAEALGDNGTLAEACRKLAEATTSGPVRSALWKRAGEAYRVAGRPGEAAEAFRAAQEYLLAGELFVESGRTTEAVQSFEKSGALTKAALAAARAGDEKSAQELLAREAETRGDLVSAADAWRRAGQPLRAAGFYERAGDLVKAGDAWKDAGRPERAAALYQKGGANEAAAEAYEATNQHEKAATIYVELKQYDKAAALFRAAGRLPAAAAALQAGHQYDEAAQLFHRTGRSLEAARCALLGGHREKAWEYLTSVPRNDEGLAELFHDLARAHLAVDEPKDAIHVLREFLPRGPVQADNLPLHLTLLGALRAAGDSGEGIELGRIAAFDPSVLDGSSVVPQLPFGEVEVDASMPSALIRTPAVHKSGPYAAVTRSPVTQKVQPPRLAIPGPAPAPGPAAAARGRRSRPRSGRGRVSPRRRRTVTRSSRSSAGAAWASSTRRSTASSTVSSP